MVSPCPREAVVVEPVHGAASPSARTSWSRIAKTIAAVITGSASMVAEAAHSWADAGNEIFLLQAERSAAKPRDASHPGGYGRDAYVWSLFAAVGLFTAGAVVSIMHGVSALELASSEDTELPHRLPRAGGRVRLRGHLVPPVVPAGAREGRRARHRDPRARVSARRTRRCARSSRRTPPRSIGLVIAFLGLLLHELTGNAVLRRARLDPGRRAARDRRGRADRPQPAVPARRARVGPRVADGARRRCWSIPRSRGSPTCTSSTSGRSGSTWWRRSTCVGDDPESDVAADLRGRSRRELERVGHG